MAWSTLATFVLEQLQPHTWNNQVKDNFQYLYDRVGGTIAYNLLNLAGSIVNADIATGAAIAYAKLALANSIVNADISTGAAIAYAKLALTGAILNADLAGSIDKAKLHNRAFMAWSNGQVSNVTGDGSQYGNGSTQVLFPTEISDPEGCYDPATGLFTAKTAGIYRFVVRLQCSGILSSHTAINLFMIRSATSPVSVGIINNNPYNIANTGGYGVFGGPVTMTLALNETVYVGVVISGGTKVVDIGGTGFLNDEFSAERIG